MVHALEIIDRDAAEMLDDADVLFIELPDDVVHLSALLGQADAHGATVDARAMMVQIADIDELLDVVGDVRPEIIAARTQLARRDNAASPPRQRRERIRSPRAFSMPCSCLTPFDSPAANFFGRP
jgi:hypothetical protein